MVSKNFLVVQAKMSEQKQQHVSTEETTKIVEVGVSLVWGNPDAFWVVARIMMDVLICLYIAFWEVHIIRSNTSRNTQNRGNGHSHTNQSIHNPDTLLKIPLISVYDGYKMSL